MSIVQKSTQSGTHENYHVCLTSEAI